MRRKFPRPRLVVSQCLEFEAVRYDGAKISDLFVRKLNDFVDFIPVCPEMEIGLGVPREPIRIVEEGGKRYLIQPATGKDVTGDMLDFTRKFLSTLPEVDGFILKNASPSSGIAQVKVYHGFEKSVRATRGAGFFGGAVLEKFPDKAVEDEKRLSNYTIREHFLLFIYTLAAFRELGEEPSMKGLVDFHSRHKYLFMAFRDSILRKLGKVVANHAGLPLLEVLAAYKSLLGEVFKKPVERNSMINVLEHIFGGVSKELSPVERQYFLNLLEEYRDERIPLSVVVHVLLSWAIRFDKQYILEQVIIHPYPVELMDISDSGKGRKL